MVTQGGGGSGEGSCGRVEGTDGDESLRFIASPGESISSKTIDWSGELGSSETIGWSRMIGCAGTVNGLATGPVVATMDGFGCWNTQS